MDLPEFYAPGAEGRPKDIVRGIEGLARETVPCASTVRHSGMHHQCQSRYERLGCLLAGMGVAPLAAHLVLMLLHAQGASPEANADQSWQTQVVRDT